MAKSSLTKGLVAGKSSGLLGAGMTTNPAIDKSTEAERAKKLLNIRATKGVKKLPPVTGAKQPATGSGGRKISGGAKIKGGRF